MKKFLIIFICLLTLVGCSKKVENKIEIVGGFTEQQNKKITKELRNKFNSAVEGIKNMKFEPLELMSTQVVAGTNYKILCNVAIGDKTYEKVVIMNEDLEQNCTIYSMENYDGSEVEYFNVEIAEDNTFEDLGDEVIYTTSANDTKIIIHYFFTDNVISNIEVHYIPGPEADLDAEMENLDIGEQYKSCNYNDNEIVCEMEEFEPAR